MNSASASVATPLAHHQTAPGASPFAVGDQSIAGVKSSSRRKTMGQQAATASIHATSRGRQRAGRDQLAVGATRTSQVTAGTSHRVRKYAGEPPSARLKAAGATKASPTMTRPVTRGAMRAPMPAATAAAKPVAA